MKRCVIVGGAPIQNYEYIKSKISDSDFIIYCDCGLNHLKKLNLTPSLIVGDFDSFPKPKTNIETIVLPCEKDDTDTMFAVKEGIKRGYKEFIIIGAIGKRFDHTLGNVSILLYLDNCGCNGKIIDDYSEIEIVSKEAKLIEDTYNYFSILNIGQLVDGVTIENAKYCLNGAQITNYYPIGVSNEVVKGKCAKVSVSSGQLLLIKIF